MAQEKGKGNILYELLIVILAVLLIGSILYPKRVKDKEDANTLLDRYRMDQVHKAELQYLRYNNVYTDTLEKVLSFIKTSPEYATYVDTMVVAQIDTVLAHLSEFRSTQEMILRNIDAATDTVMIDSLSALQQSQKVQARILAGRVELVHDLMKNLPNMPVDALTDVFLVVNTKEFTLNMDIVRNSVESGRLQDAKVGAGAQIKVIDDVAARFQAVKAMVPDYKSASLDSLSYCPTTHEPHVLVHVDTSTIKYLNVYCPIDSLDIGRVKGDFLKSKIGGLELINHGKIEKGEKSWEST